MGCGRSFIDIANVLATSLRGSRPPTVMSSSRTTRHRALVPDRRSSEPDASPDVRSVARAAGLRYASDSDPGITRRRSGRGFSYRDADGRTIRDRETLARIRALAVPPAWTDVWICPWRNGHVQASGRDARGRKQYRYHADWNRRRGTDKFDRMLGFAKALPGIRKRCDEDLATPGLTREKVLSAGMKRVLMDIDIEALSDANRIIEVLGELYGLATIPTLRALAL